MSVKRYLPKEALRMARDGYIFSLEERELFLNGALTGAEWKEINNASPEYSEKMRKIGEKREKELSVIHKRRFEDEQPIVRDLKAYGLDADSAWDYVNRKDNDYAEAFPVLIKHLTEDYSEFTTYEGLIRALAVPEARGLLGRRILNLYLNSDNQHIKFAAALNMSVTADKTILGDLPDLILKADEKNLKKVLEKALKTAKK